MNARKAFIPTAKRRRPTTAHTYDDTRCDSGPTVIPHRTQKLHSPLHRWNTDENTPSTYAENQIGSCKTFETTEKFNGRVNRSCHTCAAMKTNATTPVTRWR